jgi:hypothetical protein
MNQEESLNFEDPEIMMEMMFIDEYLKSRGYPSMKDLCKLPEEQAKKIMIEACNYASGKLAEVASKDRFLRAIHRPT